ncbi:MAG: leucyl aminopeptidase [Lentimicrobiaceae bacterium]|jgi:leucyl aminopeptidase|nr:leucyl aminopeptidase [Lentimicrobiaceae bacterium]MCP4910171.1 leucyl aminopeptidase [Bacteroidota bacterium]MBT3453794.1 leucyl aminopeptidase [Lentimicrobiaceae bacterium]MBT3819473.1 leucyl aminopeptidase [Lentimicrobiaceae bacterium]MBT4190167.1 leucyl aminopeptidase [Lentimicrobiaceae bacterium]
MKVEKSTRKPSNANIIYLVKSNKDLLDLSFSREEVSYIKNMRKVKKDIVEVNRFNKRLFIAYYPGKANVNEKSESIRVLGNKALGFLNGSKITKAVVSSTSFSGNDVIAFVEGMVLGNYQFLKYKTGENKKCNSLEEISVYSNEVSDKDIDELMVISSAVYNSRDYVNEPDSFMTAEQLAAEAKALGDDSGAKVEIFNRKKIESLKMGGLLAVNRGSINPPTFTIFEWKPKNAINEKPYIFVGKGVVYDTGGLSLKPSNFMDTMKCDMAGAAAVIGGMYAISKAKLPVHVIGLIPATDNRPDGNAYTPGDVVTMFDGSTVEVLNTDAEGRMILADALSYAKKYNPELVIDIATLTGSASRAIGSQAMVGMKVKSDKEFSSLCKSADKVHERIVEFPMWDEYADMLKSEIADRKNIGGVEAGAITAGKFLEHFTDYPYIHLDIAGPAFLSKSNAYRTVGGTGVGVRLFYEFIKSKAEGK